MATALTSGELDNLRSSSGTHSTKTYLSVIEPTTVGTAQINQSSFSNPVAELTIDNLSTDFTTDVKVGHTVWIGTTAGARDVGVYRIRKAPTSTTLYIAEMSTGDMGLLALDTLEALDDNQYITVVDSFNAWTVYSRIVFNDGGTFYKDYDDAYVDQNETTGTRVVLNLGNNQAGFVDSGTSNLSVSMTVSIEDLGSGVTVSAYSWDIDDGTLTGGSLSSSTWTATFPAGQRWVSCTATLSNGESVTGYRVIKTHDTSTNRPLELTVTSDRRTINGRRMICQLPEDDLTDTDLQTGTLVIIWEESQWSGGDVSSAITQFVGFVTRIESNAQVTGRITSIEVVSALEIAKELGFVSQQLTSASSPSNWTEVEPDLAHTEYYLFYLMYWHTSLLRIFDLNLLGTYDTYTYQAFSSSSNNLVDAMNENLARINAIIGQDSDGSLYVTREPSHMTSSERTALTERMTITEDDLASIPSFTGNFRPKVGQVRAYGSKWNGSKITPYVAYAPGVARGQGTAVEELPGQLVANQSELNTRASNQYAMVNNPNDRILLELVGNYDVFSVADVAWIRLTVGANYSPTGAALDLRCIPVEVAVTYTPEGSKTVSLTVRAETSGLNAPAEKVPVVVGNDDDPSQLPIPDIDPDTGDVVFDYDPYDWNEPDYGTEDEVIDIDDDPPGNRVVFAWAGNKLARMYPQEQQWELVYTFGQDITGLVIDESSSILTTDRQDGTLTIYVGTTTTIYSCTDALASSLSFTNTNVGSSGISLRYLRGAVNTMAGITYNTIDAGEGGTASTTLDTVTTSDTLSRGPITSRKNYKVEGTISDGTYTYDGAYRTTDGFVTRERWNIFKTDSEFIAPSNPTYNTDHEYRFAVHQTSDPLTVAYELAGTATSGSLTVTRVDVVTTTEFFFTEDNWSNIDTTNIISNTPQKGCDVADFFPFALSTNGSGLKAYEWSGTLATGDITGLSSLNSNAMTSFVRIPYRTLNTDRALNNTETALHAVYGLNKLNSSGESLWKLVLDTTSSPPTIDTETDITPNPGGVNYHCSGGSDSFAMAASDPRKMLGWFEPENGDGGTILLASTDAGVTWSIPGTTVRNGRWVEFETGTTAWLAGTDYSDDDGFGVYYATSMGDTIYDYTLNWDDVVGERPVLGVRSVQL